MNIIAKNELVVEDWWQETIDEFTYQKNIFKMGFTMDLSSSSSENKGIDWQFLN